VAFSAPETQYVSEFLLSKNGFWKGYIDFQSYGQLWMSLWGYTSVLPVAETGQENLSTAFTDALNKVHGTEYKVGPTYKTKGPASGVATDWTYGVLDIEYSFYVELRGTKNDIYGYMLPADQIQPSGEETYAALKVWALAALTV